MAIFALIIFYGTRSTWNYSEAVTRGFIPLINLVQCFMVISHGNRANVANVLRSFLDSPSEVN